MINTKENLYKFAIAESKGGLKHKENCGLRKAIDTKKTQRLSRITEGGQHDAKERKQSGLGFESTQSGISFERNSTQNVAHKENDCGSGFRSTQKFELNGHGKNEALAAKFQC